MRNKTCDVSEKDWLHKGTYDSRLCVCDVSEKDWLHKGTYDSSLCVCCNSCVALLVVCSDLFTIVKAVQHLEEHCN